MVMVLGKWAVVVVFIEKVAWSSGYEKHLCVELSQYPFWLLKI